MLLCAPGGYWKATTLVTGDYGLHSEVVIPGFEDADMQLATDYDIKDLVSVDVWNNIKHLIKPQ